MSQADAATKIKINESLKEPSMWRVIEFFDYNTETAVKITEDIHNSGQAVVAVLPHEIAEQKGSEVVFSARSQNYPLQVKLEPDAV